MRKTSSVLAIIACYCLIISSQPLQAEKVDSEKSNNQANSPALVAKQGREQHDTEEAQTAKRSDKRKKPPIYYLLVLILEICWKAERELLQEACHPIYADLAIIIQAFFLVYIEKVILLPKHSYYLKAIIILLFAIVGTPFWYISWQLKLPGKTYRMLKMLLNSLLHSYWVVQQRCRKALEVYYKDSLAKAIADAQGNDLALRGDTQVIAHMVVNEYLLSLQDIEALPLHRLLHHRIVY